MFGVDFRENTQPITGGVVQNIQFDTGIPKGALERILFIMVGANNSLEGSGIDDYVFTMDGDEWLNIKPAELRALLEFVYSRYGGAAPAANDLTWPIPLDLLGMLLPGMPAVGLPAKTRKNFLIRGNANLSVGSAEIGWKAASRKIQYVPYLIGQTLAGLVASTPGQRFEFNVMQFPTVGLIIDLGATEFTRIRFFLADDDGKVKEVSDWKRDHILMNLQPYHAGSISDPVFLPFDAPIIIKPGSYLLVDTGAGYTGAQRFVPVQFMEIKEATQSKPAA
jgi:hypothetical protein